MAKLAIDSASLEGDSPRVFVINREIFIPNREVGRFSLFYQKSGDLPPNRETWKLCMHHAEGCYETSLEYISMPVVEALCPTLYDYVYFA